MNIEYLLDNVNEDGAEGNPLVISENDIYYNWDKWITGQSHVLFVDGLSGSGKSTIAKKMANEYDAQYVEIDVIAFKIVGQKAIDKGYCDNYDYIRNQDPMLWKYMRDKYIPPDFLAHLSLDEHHRHTDKEEEFKRQEVDKYIHWLCFEQKERVVIEGGHAGVTISRHPEMYEQFPIIFKGTSLTKSVFRRMIRAGKKGKFYSPLRWFNIIKLEYMEHMYPEVNDARRKILTGKEDDILYVKEGAMKFGTIDLDIGKEKDTLHHKAKDNTKVPSGIKDFKDFCKKIKNPFMSMRWFIKNKIKWTPNGGSNDHPFQWPDWLIKQKMGNCFDQTIFMHYYCQNKRIEHKMFLITWIADNGQGSGHAVPVFKKGNYCYIWFYLRPGVGHVAGPFRNWDECQKMMNQYFLFYMNRCFGSPCDVYSSYLDEHDMKEFDQYYGDRKILQSEYIIEGLGKHMRSSHMLKIKVNGFLFPNPALPIYDAIVYAYKMLLFSNKIVPLWNDEDLEEGKKKGIKEEVEYDLEIINETSIYNRSYKDFDEFCKYIKTTDDVLNWYKINDIKWNQPDKNGSFNNKPFTWPDMMIKTKTGNCMDHALFMHYFCEKHKIPNKIIRCVRYKVLRENNKYICNQHFTCIFKEKDNWWIFDYTGGAINHPQMELEYHQSSSLRGPFKNEKEAADVYTKIFNRYLEQYNSLVPIELEVRQRIPSKTVIINDKAMKLINQFYNNYDVLQSEVYKLLRREIDGGYDDAEYIENNPIDYLANKTLYGLYRIKKAITNGKQIIKLEDVDLNMIEEAKGYSMYTKEYKNFKEFCKAMPTIHDVLNWYKTNKIDGRTIKNGSEGPFIWPDEILEKKKAICYDTALFVHYYCKSKNIPSTLLKVAVYMRGNAGQLQVCGHAVTVMNLNNSWFAFNYFGNRPEYSALFGPFPTIEDLVKVYKKTYRQRTESRGLTLEGSTSSYVFTKEDMSKFDKIYGLKIGRDAFTYSIKGCYNSRDKEALKTGNYTLLDVILYQANVYRRFKDVFFEEDI